MTEVNCAEVRDAAAEYALGILSPQEQAIIADHLQACPSCQAEVDAMSGVGARLLELVPGTEPPLGFDRRVLARVQPSDEAHGWVTRTTRRSRRATRGHPRVLMAVAAVAAALVVLVGALGGWFSSDHSSSRRDVDILMTAPLQEGTRQVGQVVAYRTYDGPVWLSMMVHDVTGAKQVSCDLIKTDGSVEWLGSFDLDGGSGSWGTPYPAGLSGLAGASLRSPSGELLATATFH